MGVFDHFPYTNFHELNLEWILLALKEIQQTMEDFVSLNAIKYADPIQWNITKQYEKNTIVIDPLTGTAYISVRPVPSGAAITDEDYWTVVFDLGQFVTKMARNLANVVEPETTLTATVSSSYNDWIIWGDVLYRNSNPSGIIAGDAYVIGSNIESFTVEDVVGHIQDLTTTDKSNLVAAINEVLQTLTDTAGDLNDLTTTDKSNLVAAINEVLLTLTETIGDLNDLDTDDKSNIVAAINSLTTININGVDYPLHITDDITLNVPAEFSSANDAINTYLKYCTISDAVTVTIKYADGTYYGNQLIVDSKDMSYLRVVGNDDHPEACRIELTYPTDPIYRNYNAAFGIYNASIMLISGFYVHGNGMRSVDGNGHVNWVSDSQQIGVNLWNNSSCEVKSMVCDSVYYPYQVGNSSYCKFSTNQNYANLITPLPTPSNISDFYGKYNIAINGGDAGVFIYNESGAECDGVISLANEDYGANLGFGIMAEHSSSIKSYGCCGGYNYISGFIASNGSALSILGSNQAYNNQHQGVVVRYASGVEIFASDIKNNANQGLILFDNCSAMVGVLSIFGNTNGIELYDSATLKFGANSASYQNTYHDILAQGMSRVDNINLLTGTSPNGSRIQNSEGSAPPTNGYYALHDFCKNTGPDANIIFGWTVEAAGNPPIWRKLYTGSHAGLAVEGFTPEDGYTYFDPTAKKLKTYYGGDWYDAGMSMNDFYPPVAVRGSCIYDGSREMPIWCIDGHNWQSANAAGTTAQRTQYPVRGEVYFDTTLNKPIFWSGSAWVDANGNNV